ncbi:MAG: hypothetical protein ACPG42_12735 [Alphaproteobacteria bacterium]
MTAVNHNRATGAASKSFSFDFTRPSQAMLLISAGGASVLCWLGLAALILL